MIADNILDDRIDTGSSWSEEEGSSRYCRR